MVKKDDKSKKYYVDEWNEQFEYRRNYGELGVIMRDWTKKYKKRAFLKKKLQVERDSIVNYTIEIIYGFLRYNEIVNPELERSIWAIRGRFLGKKYYSERTLKRVSLILRKDIIEKYGYQYFNDYLRAKLQNLSRKLDKYNYDKKRL